MSATLERGLLTPFVGGEWARTTASGRFETVNPADGSVLAELAVSGEADIDQAVAAATTAQRQWITLSAARRGDLLTAWGERIAAHADEIARLDMLDMGKLLVEARAEGPFMKRLIQYWAGMVDKIVGDQIPITPGHLSYTLREPVGVCGVILPWNGPAIMFVSRVSTALACGNGVVVKPSELSPLSALRLAELSVDAGLPPGLVNVVPGAAETGRMLVEHPGVGAIAFTGSVPTGKRIAAAAGPGFKRTVLELGGKAPNVVFDDADLDEAARGAVWGIFQGAGQVCVASTRLLLQRGIADQLTERIAELASRLRVGAPTDPAAHVGPVVSAGQLERVMRYIDIAREDGGTVIAGGGAPADQPHPDGYYVQPTVVANVDPSARVANEEVFGPVLSVLTFDDEDQALELANATEFGLSANIWTADLGRMLRMAERVEAGVVWGNTPRLMDPGLAFGGFKQSGIGSATGREAIDGVTRIKRVSLRYDPRAPMPHWPDL